MPSPMTLLSKREHIYIPVLGYYIGIYTNYIDQQMKKVFRTLYCIEETVFII